MRKVVAAGGLLLMAVTVEGQVSFSRGEHQPRVGGDSTSSLRPPISTGMAVTTSWLGDSQNTGTPEPRTTGSPSTPAHLCWQRRWRLRARAGVGRGDNRGTQRIRGSWPTSTATAGPTSRSLMAACTSTRVQSVGYGNPPQLWLSDNDGVLRPSEGLADAVRAEHALRPPAGKGLSAPADLHLKSVTSGDIDGDGDIDLWVDSIGGKNVSSHFMVNNGDGTFTVDEERAPTALRYNNPPESGIT